jgi:hypothetical protein
MNTTQSSAVASNVRHEPLVRPERKGGRLATWLALALAVDAAVASLVMLLDPGVMRGPAAMNGSARGTALTVVFVAVPTLVVSVVAARRRSSIALFIWLGALGMLTYNALMFLFATPFNRLFPLYVAWLALSVWSVGSLLLTMDVDDLDDRFSPTAARRGVAAYIWVVVAVNALAWLGKLVPGLFQDGSPDFLIGTGMTTSIVFVQDLGLWLPLMAVIAAWLWRERRWGAVLATAGLVMWVFESISVAIDQAFGAAADSSSPVASATLTPVFAALAIVGIVPILLLLKRFDSEGLVAKLARLAPPAGRRTAGAWLLAGLAASVAAAACWGGVALIRNGYDMPVRWLEGTPFTSWTWPGVALLVAVAAPHAVLAGLVTVGSPWAGLAGIVCGMLLVAWIAVQLVVLQQVFLLQPIVAAVGVLEMWLAGRWRAPSSGRP